MDGGLKIDVSPDDGAEHLSEASIGVALADAPGRESPPE